MYCPHCGSNQSDKAQYCSECGQALPAARRPVAQPAGAVSSDSMVLVEKGLLAVAVVACALLALDFVGLLLDKSQDVIDLISLYGDMTAAVGTGVYAAVAIAMFGVLVGLGIFSAQVVFGVGQAADNAWKKLSKNIPEYIVGFLAVRALKELFDTPSLSSNDLDGPFYMIFRQLGGWIDDQIGLLFLVAVAIVAAIVLRRRALGGSAVS